MSLGLKAIEVGYRVLVTNSARLIAVLTKAHAEGRLDEKLKVYTTPRLLMTRVPAATGSALAGRQHDSL